MQRARTSNRWGGALHGFWYGSGEYDGYAIYEAPDNVSLAGAVLAITAGGALASVETTVLMTVEENASTHRRTMALFSSEILLLLYPLPVAARPFAPPP
jgi:uncharacterized protein with GYD domain